MKARFGRQFVFWLAFLVVLLTFFLLVTEGLLRGLAPIRFCDAARSFQHDPELGVSFVPGLHILQTTDYQQEVRINRLGVVNFEEDFSGYPKLVFAVGDSFTQGVGLPADASYPAQLAILLNFRGGGYKPTFGVVNLGMGGYGGLQNVLQLRKYAEKIRRPDFILYLGCQNDEQDDRMFRSGERHRAIFPNTPGLGFIWKARLWITRQTEIGKRLRLARERLHNPDLAGPLTVSGNSTLGSQIKNIEKIANQAQDWGSRLIVGWASDDGDYLALQKWAAEKKVDFADWAPGVRSVLKAIPSLPIENPHSGGHYRTWANGIIAQSFCEKIMADERPGETHGPAEKSARQVFESR